jgi:hypothetical protein
MNNLEDFIYRIDGIGERPQVKRDYYGTAPIKHSDLRPSDPIRYLHRAYLISLISDLFIVEHGGEFFPRLVIGGSPYFITRDQYSQTTNI